MSLKLWGQKSGEHLSLIRNLWRAEKRNCKPFHWFILATDACQVDASVLGFPGERSNVTVLTMFGM
jgi:hypothetical protein